MTSFFESDTADNAWQMVAQSILAGASSHTQSSRIGPTLEIPQAVVTISNPRERWVVSRKPPLNPAFAIAEVFWILGGRNDSGFLNYWNRQLPEFAGHGSTYHGAYGYRIRQHLGFDQLERAYEALANVPDGRQVVLQIWDSRIDLPDTSGNPAAPDIPCNICSILKIREKALNWTQILRSNDVFLGLPYNIIQFTTLQEIVAGWLGVRVGAYTSLSDSLHLYDRDRVKVVDSLPIRANANSDTLMLPWDESREVIQGLITIIDSLVVGTHTRQHLLDILASYDGPIGYRNLVAIMVAEAGRRAKLPEVTAECIANCQNHLLVQVWMNWAARFAEN